MLVLQRLVCSQMKMTVMKKPVGRLAGRPMSSSGSSQSRSGASGKSGWAKSNAARKEQLKLAAVTRALEKASDVLTDEMKQQVAATLLPATVDSLAASVACAAPVTPARRMAPEESSPPPTKAACVNTTW